MQDPAVSGRRAEWCQGSLVVPAGSVLWGKHLMVAGLIRDAERGKGTSACPAGPPLSSTADGLGLPVRGRV